MPYSVNEAFEVFLSNTVRLDANQSSKASKSLDNLISNLNSFSGDDDFFNLNENAHLKMGSFARKTKIRPLDDIDLMICISGDGRKHFNKGEIYYITGVDSDKKNGLITSDTNYLNSTKVINRYIKKLGNLNDYQKSEMHKNMEAATLQLKSYSWNFDIVPCFYTVNNQYLIPDGYGNWKLTNPKIDNQRISSINQKHRGKLLDIIRVMKYWNQFRNSNTVDSYLLECMVLDIYEKSDSKDIYYVDLEFRDLLSALSSKVYEPVYDPKGIQGDLNTLSYDIQRKVSDTLADAYLKAFKATMLELNDKDHKAAIGIWREVLGDDFPRYGE